MYLKRIYNTQAPRDDWKLVAEVERAMWPDGTVAAERQVERMIPPLVGVEVRRAPPRQKFSPRIIARGSNEGWLTLTDTQIIVRGVEGSVAYRIERTPGRYCCHCDAKLPEDVTGEMARLHVSARHPGVASPHPGHPAGYGMTTAYECRREG